MATTFINKANILADLWIGYDKDEDFVDFIEYCDLGLPLAYAIANGIVEASDKSSGFVNEAFDLLLAGLELEDTGFETLEQLLSSK